MATYALTVSTNALGLGVISGATVVVERKRTTVNDIYPTSSLYTTKVATNISGVATIQLGADDGTVFHEVKIFDTAGVLVYKNTIQMPPQAADIDDLPLNDIISASAYQAVQAKEDTEQLKADTSTLKNAAQTSETNASNSADAAATSATNAANSADAAATSVTNASNSANAASTSATNASNAQLAAEAARDAAIIGSGVYVDEPTGRAAVADGQAFKVQGSGDVAAYEYRRVNSGSSTLIATYPSLAAITANTTSVNTLNTFKSDIDTNAVTFVYPKNLYNPATKQVDKYVVADTGNISTSAGWACSGYIPVVAGQQYTISANATKRTGLSFFASNVTTTAIVGSYNSNSTPLTVTAPAGANYLVVNVQSNTIPEPSQIQVEQGAVDTTFEAWFTAYRNIDRDNLSTALKAELDTINKDYEVTVISPNLLNVATVRDGKYIDSSIGNIASSAGWGCSDFIPVTAGQQYTISGTRGRQGVSFFTTNSNSAAVAGSYDATITLPLTVTAPATANYMVINLYSPTAPTYSNVQVEHGAAVSDYLAYGTYKFLDKDYVQGGIRELPSNIVAKMVLDSAATSYIECVIAGSDTQRIKHTIKPFGMANLATSEVFNFYDDHLDNVLFKQAVDDVAPYRVTGTTVGANHGYAKTDCTVTGHVKTSVDIGSVWTDGTNQWVIIDTQTNVISITARTSNAAFVSGTLTHVSGATNTASFTPSAVSSKQMYPVIKNRILKCAVDGQTLPTLDGTFYYYDNATFNESYEIMNKSSIVEWLITQVGLSPTPNDYTGTSDLSVSISYVFDTNGNCTIYTDFLALNAVAAFQDIMFVQCQKFMTGFGNIRYYIPNSLPLTHESISYDFRTLQDMTSFTASSRINFTHDKCEAGKQLCDRVLQLNDNVGMAVGYLPVLDAASDIRRTNASNKALQISEISKIYMSCIDGLQTSLAAGDYFSAVAYRNFFKRTSARTSCYAVRHTSGTYLYMDWHSATTDRVPIPVDLVGKAFTVVEKSSNVNVLSGSNLTNSLVVQVTAAASYGYLIIKVS